MNKLLFVVIFLFLEMNIECRPQRETRQLMRSGIKSVEEQKCQEDYQTTMSEHTNKYRSLNGLKPLQVSKKLQYVALQAAQRCHVFNDIVGAVESFLLFNTVGNYGLDSNISSIECKSNAVEMASDWYDLENWTALDKEFNFTYMGCAIEIVDSTACHVCYYQTDKGADKLEQEIIPAEVNIDLESYKDSYWTQFPDIIEKGTTEIRELRPTINSVEEQRCQEDFHTTMIEQTNKYRSLKGLKSLQGSKKLQYVALLTAQKCHELGRIKARESFLLFNTGWSTLTLPTSIDECKENAVRKASTWYDWGGWTALNEEEDYSYMGCAVSVVNNLGCNVCYYQNEKGADKLELDIKPPWVKIDLKSYNDSFWKQFPDLMSNDIIPKNYRLGRPTINSLEEQKCQEDYQTTMLEHSNKYRSLNGLKPLQGSKKLQYVALLATQRCHALNSIEKSTNSLQLFNTKYQYDPNYNTSIKDCQKNALARASGLYYLEDLIGLEKIFPSIYMGCAISIVNRVGCHVCYYQDEKGGDKLKLNIVPAGVNIDLESYNDSFWTQYKFSL